jgi:hypothetical protein
MMPPLVRQQVQGRDLLAQDHLRRPGLGLRGSLSDCAVKLPPIAIGAIRAPGKDRADARATDRDGEAEACA